MFSSPFDQTQVRYEALEWLLWVLTICLLKLICRYTIVNPAECISEVDFYKFKTSILFIICSAVYLHCKYVFVVSKQIKIQKELILNRSWDEMIHNVYFWMKINQHGILFWLCNPQRRRENKLRHNISQVYLKTQIFFFFINIILFYYVTVF